MKFRACASGRSEAISYFGTVETWLIWKMTKGKVHVTDYTNASRTMLFNIHTLKWDEDILKELTPALAPPRATGETASTYFGGPIDCGSSGRPAGGAVRPDLLCAGRSEKYIRNRLLPADEHGEKSRFLRHTACLPRLHGVSGTRLRMRSRDPFLSAEPQSSGCAMR